MQGGRFAYVHFAGKQVHGLRWINKGIVTQKRLILPRRLAWSKATCSFLDEESKFLAWEKELGACGGQWPLKDE